MKVNFVPIICIVFLTLFLLVVVPITKTPKGDIEIMDSPATTGNVTVKTDNIGLNNYHYTTLTYTNHQIFHYDVKHLI
jgi:hypothetical protein